MTYKLLDSGHGEKLEQWGEVVLIRPAAQAVWKPHLSKAVWGKAHARFSRDPHNQWTLFKPIPAAWEVALDSLRFSLKRTDFGHVGLFPEHTRLWPWLYEHTPVGCRVLHLFAYSGATTLALAAKGAKVTHLDAAKGMVQWARENALRNELGAAPIRWIVDDVRKFLVRAKRREDFYDAIILDPPSFGHGASKEIFKIEEDLFSLLEMCRALFSSTPRYLLLTCHTPLYTPLAMQQVLRDVFSTGSITAEEMFIEGPYNLPSGTCARWKP